MGILEADTVKQVEMKEHIRKNTTGERKRQLETKLRSRNLIKRIHTWALAVLGYSGPFSKWTRELQQRDQRTRKLMIMHEALQTV